MPSDPVTLMITRVPKLGHEAEWEALIAKILRAAQDCPGNLGATILKPASTLIRTYQIFVRFDSSTHLRLWEESPQRLELLNRLASIESEPVTYEHASGLETWFEFPENAIDKHPITPPQRYKMMIVSGIGVYLTITPLLAMLQPVLLRFPIYVATMILVPCVVILLTYFVMPFMTKLFRSWLYDR